MDLLYSVSLLVSLIMGGAGTLLGLIALQGRWPRRTLIRAGLAAVALGALGLLVSVTVHWHWGHGPASPEPMNSAQFIDAHAAFPVAGAIIVAGLVLLLSAKRRHRAS